MISNTPQEIQEIAQMVIDSMGADTLLTIEEVTNTITRGGYVQFVNLYNAGYRQIKATPFVSFSARKQLERDYYNWLAEQNKDIDAQIMDCPLTVISYLSGKGLLNI